MKRFAALGLLVTSAAVATADPVSVHPPAPPPSSGSSLNQSLPAAIQSALPAAAPPPVLSSTPSWTDQFLPTRGEAIPTVAPNYLAPAPAAGCAPAPAPAACGSLAPTCGPVYPEASRVRPHLNLLQRPGWLTGARAGDTGCAPAAGCAPTGGCSSGGSCRDQLKAWLHFQPTPSGVPIWSPTPYRAPLRAYFPARPTDCDWNLGCAVGGGCGQAGCATCGQGRAAGGRLGGLFHRQSGDATAPPTGDCATGNCRPRVVYVPLSPPADGACADGGANGGGAASRPSLLDRVKSAVGGGHRFAGQTAAGCGVCSGAGVSFGGGYGCPPPPPAPVHYASPCVPPPAQQPSVNYAPVPPFGGPTVGPTTPTTGVKGPGTISVPKPADAAQPFTNP